MSSSRPTIIDVAELAGVSKSLVSMVLRGATNVSDEKRAAVLAAAEELDYRPNAAARSLVQQRTELIGVLVSDFGSFYSEFLEGAQEAAAEAGYSVLCNTGGGDPQRERAALETLLELRMDGIVLGSPLLDDEQIERVVGDAPAVMIGRSVELGRTDSLANDDGLGAGLVVDHLVELGHTRIAHGHGGATNGAGPRSDGYVAAMHRHGLEPVVVDAGFTEADGIAAANRVLRLSPRPTAVFAANDMAAIGMLRAVGEADLRVPEDISLVGYDNVRAAGLRHVDLTTVDQPRQGMGRMAVELIVDRIRTPREARHVRIAPHLIVRSSSGPPPS